MKFFSSISAALIGAASLATYTYAAPLSSSTSVARKYDSSTTTASIATYTYAAPPSSSSSVVRKYDNSTTAPAYPATTSYTRSTGYVVPVATSTSVPANAYPSGPVYTAVPKQIATWNVAKHYIQAWYPEHPWISTKTSNGGQDITVLASFEIPDQYANNKCELIFDMYKDDQFTYAEGTRIGNIFSSFFPAAEGKNNGRNQDIGELHVVKGQRTYGYNKPIVFPCAAGTNGKYWNMEMVPQGDHTRISWTGPSDGLKVLVHPQPYQY